MKRSLAHDVQKAQLVVIFAFALFTAITVGTLLWQKTIEDRKAQLNTLTELLEANLTEKQTAMRVLELSEEGDAGRLRQLLEPGIKKIVNWYPKGFVGGFYSRSLDRVIVVYGKDPSLTNKVAGQRLPPDDPGRSTWVAGETRAALLLSKVRNAWILKIDNPVILNGEVIGHTFANVTLADLLGLYKRTATLLLVGIMVSSMASLLVSRRATGRIRRNVRRLSLMSAQAGLPDFDYDEFDKVAKANYKAYNDLRKAEKQKTQMLSHFPWGYLIVDSSGTYIDINEKGAAIVGLKREQVVGQKAGFYERETPVKRVLSEKATIETEQVMNLPSGARNIHSCTFPITLDSGGEGAMSWFIDVTEQRKMQLAVQHLERLSTVGEMTSIIAHNIRNPLAVIKAMAQLAQLESDQGQLSRWKQINGLADQINNYLERILTLCKPAGDNLAPCSAADMFDNDLTMLQGKIGCSQITIEKQIVGPDPVIMVNQLDFQHVLLNLVNNALEAISAVSDNGKIFLKAGSTEGAVCVQVSDTGCGIPEDELPKIWNMFYTTKPQGSGIGLAMAKRVVEQCGGRIEVSSVEGQGTTFTILLPPAQSRGLQDESKGASDNDGYLAS